MIDVMQFNVMLLNIVVGLECCYVRDKIWSLGHTSCYEFLRDFDKVGKQGVRFCDTNFYLLADICLLIIHI